MKFKTLGIIVKPESDVVKETLTRLVDYLRSKSCRIMLDESASGLYDTASDTDSHKPVTREQLAKQCDLAITIGGDGTILNAARSLADAGVPLVGINIGRLGFLADVSPDDLENALDSILDGQYQQEQRFLLTANVQRNGKTIFGADALNDVVIHVRDVARMIEFETRINGRFVSHQRADGLVVATPTGSTAYALSSGGPILTTSLEAITVVPICPHTLSNRPIVTGSDSVVEVLIRETKTAIAQVTCDGQTALDLEVDDCVTVKRKPNTITLLHPPEYSNFEILRAKLHWR